MTLTALYHHEFRAMACGMGFWVAGCDAAGARAAFERAEAAVHEAEQVLSRFLPTSELSQLNAAAGRPVGVSPLLWDTLTAGLAAARRTGGLFDPTILPALNAAGYDRPFAEIETRGAVAYRLELRPPDWGSVHMDRVRQTVLLPAGVAIDLGGIAKGWLADRVADDLAAIGPCLVDIGGDIAVRGTPAGQPGWAVGVADPRYPERDLVVLALRDCGIATSGRDYRVWTADGEDRHHIIDPRTGRPAVTDVLSSTVVAGNALDAEVAAKVTLIRGSQDGLDWLEGQGAEGLLVRDDGTVGVTEGFSNLQWNRPAAEGVLV